MDGDEHGGTEGEARQGDALPKCGQFEGMAGEPKPWIGGGQGGGQSRAGPRRKRRHRHPLDTIADGDDAPQQKRPASGEPFHTTRVDDGGGTPGIQNPGMDPQFDYNQEVLDKHDSILYNVGIRHIER